MNIGISYKVGDAATPLFPHPTFKEFDAAQEEALLQANEQPNVVAIWEVKDDTQEMVVLCLVFLECLWIPQQVQVQ